MNSYKYSYSQYLYPVGLLGNRIGVCTAKWFYQMRVPVASHPCQHLASLAFSVLAV